MIPWTRGMRRPLCGALYPPRWVSCLRGCSCVMWSLFSSEMEGYIGLYRLMRSSSFVTWSILTEKCTAGGRHCCCCLRVLQSFNNNNSKKEKEEWPRSGHFSRLRLRTVWEIAQVLESERERGERGRWNGNSFLKAFISCVIVVWLF